MKLISHSQRVHCEEWSLTFTWLDDAGAGFSFPCDREGNLLPGLSFAAQHNLAHCLAHPELIRANGVVRYEWSYIQYAIGRCSCGREVELDGFTNTCLCGLDYNMSGQLLAPRSQWGEETGEHWSECY